MISLYDYNKLSLDERATLLWRDGVFALNIIDRTGGYSLHTLYGFYVEVITKDEIVEITPFKQGERLEKYLPLIDVENF